MASMHFFYLEENRLNGLFKLFKNKQDGQYMVLNESNGYSDIAQYSEKYQNIRIISVKTDHLKKEDELA